MGLFDWLSPKRTPAPPPSQPPKPEQVAVMVPILELKLSDYLDFSSILPQILPMAEHHAGITRPMTLAEKEQYIKSVFEQNDIVWGMWTMDGETLDFFPLKGYILLKSAAMGRPIALVDNRQQTTTAILCPSQQGLMAKAMAEGLG